MHFFYNGMIVDVDMMKVMRYERLKTQCPELAKANDHFLEYLEIGVCLGDLQLNIVLVVPDKRGKKIEYKLQVANYEPKNSSWAFIFLSRGGKKCGHYELLVKKHDAFFDNDETREIFERFQLEYPTRTIKPETQIHLIDVDDLYYI